MFFTAPVPAETARRLGTALLREAMAVRGRMDLASYDRRRLGPGSGVTGPGVAQWKAQQAAKRPKAAKLATNPKLGAYVEQ